MIELSVNGETARIDEQVTLSGALDDWGYGEGKVAVAVNGEFVPRSSYPQRTLAAGDQIDIVKPIGGG